MKGNKNDIVLVGKLSGYIMVGVLYWNVCFKKQN